MAQAAPQPDPPPEKGAPPRAGRRLASTQKECDCCSSPKRRRGPRRSRQRRPLAAADRADEVVRRSPLRAWHSSSSGSSTKARSRIGSLAATAAATRRKSMGFCCSSGCETETLQSTSASGRDEPTAGRAFPCVSTKRSRELTAEKDAEAEAAATPHHEAVRTHQHSVSDGTDSDAALPQREQQQKQQQDLCRRTFPYPNAGRRAAAVVCQAAAAVSAAAAAAGAAAAACQGVRHSTSQTAGALAQWSFPLSLPHLRNNSAAAAAAAAAANIRRCNAVVAGGRSPLPSEACGLPEAAAAAAAAECGSATCLPVAGGLASGPSEVSRAAYWREELLHRAESRYTAVFIPVDKKLAAEVDCDFVVSDISRYPVKTTPCGE